MLKEKLTTLKKKPLAAQHSTPVGIPLYVKRKPLAAQHSTPVGILRESTIDDVRDSTEIDKTEIDSN